jgi:hypothetical protein
MINYFLPRLLRIVKAETRPLFQDSHVGSSSDHASKCKKLTHDICHLRKGDNDGGAGNEASHKRMRHKAHGHLKNWRGDLIET